MFVNVCVHVCVSSLIFVVVYPVWAKQTSSGENVLYPLLILFFTAPLLTLCIFVHLLPYVLTSMQWIVTCLACITIALLPVTDTSNYKFHKAPFVRYQNISWCIPWILIVLHKINACVITMVIDLTLLASVYVVFDSFPSLSPPPALKKCVDKPWRYVDISFVWYKEVITNLEVVKRTILNHHLWWGPVSVLIVHWVSWLWILSSCSCWI